MSPRPRSFGALAGSGGQMSLAPAAFESGGKGASFGSGGAGAFAEELPDE